MSFLKKLFGKSTATKPAHKKANRRLPERKLAPVEEIVEQGVLVANVAARMGVKNTIIMNALRRDVDYNPAQIQDLVKQKFEELAAERQKDAGHIKRVRDEVRKYGRSAWQETEYGSDDMRTLKHRQEVYETLSEKLLGEAADETFVANIAAEARDQAWAEIGDSLKERATHPYYSGGDTVEYQREREGRIQTLIESDLADLLKARKANIKRINKQTKK